MSRVLLNERSSLVYTLCRRSTRSGTSVRSPQRGLHALRRRSKRDVTISDMDAADVLDHNALLHREHGDQHGLSSDNVMLCPGVPSTEFRP